MAQNKFALSDENERWLKGLWDEIWEKVDAHTRDNFSGRSYHTEKRKLTSEEWDRLKGLILDHELPCMPDSGTWGFGFSLNVFGHSDSPNVKPDLLVSVTGNHLPFLNHPSHKDWDRIWATFEPFTHSPRNRELLMLYGFGEPGDRLDYEY